MAMNIRMLKDWKGLRRGKEYGDQDACAGWLVEHGYAEEAASKSDANVDEKAVPYHLRVKIEAENG
jgi:hypothetical protein